MQKYEKYLTNRCVQTKNIKLSDEITENKAYH